MTEQTNADYRRAADRLETYARIEHALAGLFTIDRYAWSETGALSIQGQLSRPAEHAYRPIRAALEPLGYTPFLRARDGAAELIATPGVLDRTPARRTLPIVLFLLTALSCVITGALHEYSGAVDSVDGLFGAILAIVTSPAELARGVPFAATVLGILGTHELGHYIVGRWRGAPVSPPYFIPVPPGIGFTGTLGAVIVQREPLEDRRTTLEVGIAGPIAGLLVAVPLLLYGLSISTIGPSPTTGYLQEGNSLLYAAAKWLVFGQLLPANGLDVQLGPVAWGAWIGLLITMINLIPIGQLDGGHIAFALLGARARYLGYAMLASCALLGLLIPDNQSWLVWCILGLLIGARHPPPLNDIPKLGGWHIALAIGGLVLFLLLFMPVPLREVLPS